MYQAVSEELLALVKKVSEQVIRCELTLNPTQLLTLAEEALASMPLDAIELAMANQVGSGLSNLEVAPGKALPFTVVIATVPEGAKNIAVVPAGSQALGEKTE